MKRRGRLRLAADPVMLAVWRYRRGGLDLPDAIRAALGDSRLSSRSKEYRQVMKHYATWAEKWGERLQAYDPIILAADGSWEDDGSRCVIAAPGRPTADETPLVPLPPVQLRGDLTLTSAATPADAEALYRLLRLLGVPVRLRRGKR
jgi:hypothetical protein